MKELNFERIPAMNQAIPLANPGLTLDGVTVERPRPKEAIISIKIRSFIILYLKLGWTDANFWDTVFDSTASKEPTVEKNEISKIFDEDNDNDN